MIIIKVVISMRISVGMMDDKLVKLSVWKGKLYVWMCIFISLNYIKCDWFHNFVTV